MQGSAMSTGSVPASSWRALFWGAANRQRWFVAGLLVFFFLLSIQYSYKAVAGRSAFLRWRTQIEHLDDVDIYQRFKYPNPPIMALLLEWLVPPPPPVVALPSVFPL